MVDVVARRKRLSRVTPWKLGGLSVVELGRRVWHDFQSERILTQAAALSYYFVFSLFPALLFVMSLVALVRAPGLVDGLMAYAHSVLPGDAASLVDRTVRQVFNGQHQGLLSIGVVLALWSASSAMASVMDALDVAYDVEDSRPWWRFRLTAIGLTVVFSVFVVVALVLMMFGAILGERLAAPLALGGVVVTAWNVVSVPLALVLVLVGIALVYYLAPDVEQEWHWVTPGSAIAVVLWVVMSIGLRFYAAHFADYGATYGSVGGIILLLLWLYLTGIVMLLGAAVNAEIEHAAALRGEPTAKEPGEKAA